MSDAPNGSAPKNPNMAPAKLVSPDTPWESQVRVVPQKDGSKLVILHVCHGLGDLVMAMRPDNAEDFFRKGYEQALRAQGKPVPGDIAIATTDDVKRILRPGDGHG